MSNEPKKTGARDISDLKARLGLKKGEARQTGQNPAVPSPAGGRLSGSFVPPPPGVAGPGPQIPDARLDPFGAMNAMAAHGAVKAQPEIIVVNDGKPVESVQNKSKAGKYVKTALLIIVPVAIGFFMGGINFERGDVNRTIRSAGVIKGELAQVGKQLDGLKFALQRGRENQGDQFKPHDMALTTELEGLNFSVTDEQKLIVYHQHLFKMDPQLVDDTLDFYANVQQLTRLVSDHIKASKSDANATAPDPMQTLGKDAPPGTPRLGIILRSATDKDRLRAEIVQLGQPVCQAGGQPSPQGCGAAPPAGFQFRPDPSPLWGTKEYTAAEVAADKIVEVGYTGILAALLQGSPQWVSTKEYMSRINNIDALTNALIEQRRSIDDRMNALANRSTSFALGDD